MSLNDNDNENLIQLNYIYFGIKNNIKKNIMNIRLVWYVQFNPRIAD